MNPRHLSLDLPLEADDISPVSVFSLFKWFPPRATTGISFICELWPLGTARHILLCWCVSYSLLFVWIVVNPSSRDWLRLLNNWVLKLCVQHENRSWFTNWGLGLIYLYDCYISPSWGLANISKYLLGVYKDSAMTATNFSCLWIVSYSSSDQRQRHILKYRINV